MGRTLRSLNASASASRQLETDSIVLIYDGTCGACNAWVRFLIAINRKKNIYFAGSDSPLGNSIRCSSNPATFYVLQRDGIQTESSAVLVALGQCCAPFSWISIFLKIPKPKRDGLLISMARRIKKMRSKVVKPCNRPSEEVASRILWSDVIFAK